MNQQDYQYIDKQADLDRLTELMPNAQYAAIDIEGNSLYKYFERVCLLQLATDFGCYVLDTLAKLDFVPFMRAHEQTNLILHGYDYDLRMMQKDFAFNPSEKVFDTHKAAMFLGLEKIGLNDLLREVLDVDLPKDQQLSNWTIRPLSPEQLSYAVNDIAYLRPLSLSMTKMLEEADKLKWYNESMCQIAESAGSYKQKEVIDPWRVKGSRELNQAQLRFLRELWLWRDGVAQEIDRPPFKVLQNNFLIEIAELACADPSFDVHCFRRIRKHIRPKYMQQLAEAVKRAEELPKDKWPDKYLPRKEYQPIDKELTAKLRDYVGKVARENALEPSMLAKRIRIEAATKVCPKNNTHLKKILSLEPWQEKLILKGMMDIIREHCSV